MKSLLNIFGRGQQGASSSGQGAWPSTDSCVPHSKDREPSVGNIFDTWASPQDGRRFRASSQDGRQAKASSCYWYQASVFSHRGCHTSIPEHREHAPPPPFFFFFFFWSHLKAKVYFGRPTGSTTAHARGECLQSASQVGGRADGGGWTETDRVCARGTRMLSRG